MKDELGEGDTLKCPRGQDNVPTVSCPRGQYLVPEDKISQGGHSTLG